MSDMAKAISGNEVKNGTSVTTTTVTGRYSKLDTYVSNAPAVADVETKYDVKFDDPSYYYGNCN